MTVKELIDALSKMPENQNVVVDGYEGGFCDISSLKKIKVKLNVHEESYYGPHEESSDADTEVIKIVRIENPNSK